MVIVFLYMDRTRFLYFFFLATVADISCMPLKAKTAMESKVEDEKNTVEEKRERHH